MTCVYDAALGAVVGLQFGVQSVCEGSLGQGTASNFTVPATGYISSLKVSLTKAGRVGGMWFKVEDTANPAAPPLTYACGNPALPGGNLVPKGMALATLGAGCLRADPNGRLALDGGALYPVVVAPTVSAVPTAGRGTYIYAILDGSRLYEIDVASQSWTPILTATTGGSPNGLAYDTLRNDLFWMSAAPPQLFYWNRQGAYTRLATTLQLGLGPGANIASGAYWANSVWFM